MLTDRRPEAPGFNEDAKVYIFLCFFFKKRGKGGWKGTATISYT